VKRMSLVFDQHLQLRHHMRGLKTDRHSRDVMAPAIPLTNLRKAKYMIGSDRAKMSNPQSQLRSRRDWMEGCCVSVPSPFKLIVQN
jgi:hypothetical protein